MLVKVIALSCFLLSSAFSSQENSPDFLAPRSKMKRLCSIYHDQSPLYSDERSKVVLSFDGGGLRGIFSLHVFQEIDKALPEKLNRYVDLIAGTSTGAMIALGLGMNKKPEEILTLYTQRNKDVFHSSFCHKIQSGFGYLNEKYSVQKLEPLLQEFYGSQTKLSHMTDVDVMAITVDMTGGFQKTFSTFSAKKTPEEDPFIWQVARFTSAAPTYFEPASYKAHVFVDGGLVANNPSLEASLLIQKTYGWDAYKKLKTLSIGTSNYYPSYTFKEVKDWGKLQWAAPLGPIMIYTSSNSTHESMTTLYPENQYIRLNTLTDQNIGLDSVKDVGSITDIALKYIKENPQTIDKARKMVLDNGTKRSF